MLKANVIETSQIHCLISLNEYGIILRAIFVILSLSGLVYCFGCSGANYGGLKPNQEVTRAFETYHIYPEHRYYHLHLENSPYAVIALHNSFTISSRQWTEFDPQTDKLKKIVDLIKQFPEGYYRAYGAGLKNPPGNQLGYWYSSIRLRSLKVDNEAKKVSIYTDTPWLRDRGRGFGTGIGIRIGR
jgi:hypothetical protein